MNTPDKWVIIKIKEKEKNPIYKVFGTWYGGYLDGDSWRMNSGIVRVEIKDDYINFYGASGSCYKCYKNYYGTNSYTQGVIEDIIKKGKNNNINVDILPKDTQWMDIL